MPEDFGDDSGLARATMRGRDWPSLRQFCVFLENRVGSLHELLRALERDDLRVVALAVIDTVDFAVVRVILDQPERATELLQLGGFTYIENDILGVELPDNPQPYGAVINCLMRAEMNVHYTYPLLYRRSHRGAIAVFVENLEQAGQILRDAGHTLLTEGDLLDSGDFF